MMAVYDIPTRIIKIEEKIETMRTRMIGGEAVAETRNTGWWVLFEHSYDLLFMGMEKPDLKLGPAIIKVVQ